jgi:hypothetical protein
VIDFPVRNHAQKAAMQPNDSAYLEMIAVRNKELTGGNNANPEGDTLGPAYAELAY